MILSEILGRHGVYWLVCAAIWLGLDWFGLGFMRDGMVIDSVMRARYPLLLLSVF
jgi:hypothetical protein